MGDQDYLDVLRNYGLLKFFMVPSLSTQLDLVQYLVGAWDLNEAKFNIQGKVVEIKVAHIY